MIAMKKFYFNSKNNVLEATNVTGCVQIFLDDTPAMKWKFRHKIKVKFILEDNSECPSSLSDFKPDLQRGPDSDNSNNLGQKNILKNLASNELVTEPHERFGSGELHNVKNVAGANFDSVSECDGPEIKSENICEDEVIKNSVDISLENGCELASHQLQDQSGAEPENVSEVEMHSSLIGDKEQPFSFKVEAVEQNTLELSLRQDGTQGSKTEGLVSETPDINEEQAARDLTCTICNKRFQRSTELQAHRKNPKCQVKCKECGLLSSCKAELLLHLTAQHDGNSIQNQFPGLSLRTDCRMGINRVSKSTSCPICSFSCSSSKFSVAEHINSLHFEELIYKCCVCSESMKNYSLFKFHRCDPSKERKNRLKVMEELHSSKTQGLKRSRSNVTNIQTKSRELCVMEQNCIKSNTNNIPEGHEKDTEQSVSGSEYSTSSVRNRAKKIKLHVKGLSPMSNSSKRKVKVEPRTCKYCKVVFNSFAELRSHKETPSLNLSCHYCKKVLTSKAGLLIHEQELHSPTSSIPDQEIQCLNTDSPPKDQKRRVKIPCPVCLVQISREYLTDHVMRLHTNEYSYRCCICLLPCRTQEYRRHCSTHLGATSRKGKFHCSVCPKVCLSRGEFSSHMATHRTVCHFCNKDFQSVKLLGQHHISYHRDQLMNCSKCEKLFATERQLKSHERDHRFRIRKQCPKCGAMVFNLVTHNRVHTEKGEVAFCSFCSHKSSNQMELQKHLAECKTKNPSIGPFPCQVCSKSFDNRRCLRRHVYRTHANNQLHTCHICGKQSKSKTNLKIHMRIHTSETLFNCHLCEKGFKYNSSLQKHLVSTHREDS